MLDRRANMITTIPIWSTQVKHASVSFSALVRDPEMELWASLKCLRVLQVALSLQSFSRHLCKLSAPPALLHGAALTGS